MKPRSGPFEDQPWPTKLRANVIADGEQPRIHGYELERDLCPHYSLGELMLLGLVGEAPSRVIGRAFEVALAFACLCPVNEAPTHAAVLARTLGAPLSGALAAGFMITTEAVRTTVEHHRPLLKWTPGTPPPECARACDDRDIDAVRNLIAALAEIGGAELTLELEAMSRTAAILTVLSRCGLSSEDQLVAALSWAKTISVGAEAAAAPLGQLSSYAAKLPDFRYEAPDER